MSKHTPGPWTLVNGYNIFSELGADSGDGYKAPENDGWLIANVERGSVTNDDGEIIEIGYDVFRANAHLIAAAPDLLEALEEIIEWVERCASPDHPIATVARKALEAYQQGDDEECQ